MPLTTDFATALIDYARTWLGCKEDIKTPNRSTCVNQIQELFNGTVTDEPWCAKFVWVVADHVAKQFGIKNTLPHVAGTHNMVNQAAANADLLVDVNPAPGSVFFYSTSGSTGHVGYVISVNDDGTINTIEGNHNNSVSYGHRDVGADSSFRFIHTETMAGGKNLVLGLPQNQILLYGGIGLVASFIGYKILNRHG